MEIEHIFIELITLFTELDLLNLILVSKKLNICIMNIFKNKLKLRHNDCVLMGDGIELNTFCYQYIKLLKYNEINKNTNLLDYDYCSDCNSFGLQNIIVNTPKICKFGCTLTCCDIKTVAIVLIDYVLMCGCPLTTRCAGHICKCGNIIKNSTTKCEKCKKIPLRFQPDKYKAKYEKYRAKYNDLKNYI